MWVLDKERMGRAGRNGKKIYIHVYTQLKSSMDFK